MAIKEIEEYYNHLSSYHDVENYYDTMTYPAFCLMADRIGYQSKFTVPRYFDQIATLLGFTPPYNQQTIDWVEILVKQAEWYSPESFNSALRLKNKTYFKDTAYTLKFSVPLDQNTYHPYFVDNNGKLTTKICNVLGISPYNGRNNGAFSYYHTYYSPGFCIGKTINGDMFTININFDTFKKKTNNPSPSTHSYYLLEFDGYSAFSAYYDYFQKYPTDLPVLIIPTPYLAFSGGQPFLPNYTLHNSGVIFDMFELNTNFYYLNPDSGKYEVKASPPVNNYPPFLPANATDMSNSLIDNINFNFFGENIYGIPTANVNEVLNPYV